MPARCVWLATDVGDAQVNVILRMIDAYGALPTPEDIRARSKSDPRFLGPTAQFVPVALLASMADREPATATARGRITGLGGVSGQRPRLANRHAAHAAGARMSSSFSSAFTLCDQKSGVSFRRHTESKKGRDAW